MDEDVRVVGYCEDCGVAITNNDEAYIDNDGLYFDSIECVLSYYNIQKVEF